MKYIHREWLHTILHYVYTCFGRKKLPIQIIKQPKKTIVLLDNYYLEDGKIRKIANFWPCAHPSDRCGELGEICGVSFCCGSERGNSKPWGLLLLCYSLCGVCYSVYPFSSSYDTSKSVIFFKSPWRLVILWLSTQLISDTWKCVQRINSFLYHIPTIMIVAVGITVRCIFISNHE